MEKIDFENLEKKRFFEKLEFLKIIKNRKFSLSNFHLKISKFSEIFQIFKNLMFFKKNFFFEIFKINFLHDKKIFFTQFFLWFLIYISTDARNHLEHPGSELHTRISRNAKKNHFFPLIDTYPAFELPTW